MQLGVRKEKLALWASHLLGRGVEDWISAIGDFMWWRMNWGNILFEFLRNTIIYSLLLEGVVKSITTSIPLYQNHISSLKKQGCTIVGYARKSTGHNDEENRKRLLNSMVQCLKERSLCDMVLLGRRWFRLKRHEWQHWFAKWIGRCRWKYSTYGILYLQTCEWLSTIRLILIFFLAMILYIDQNQFKVPKKSKYSIVMLYLSLSLADIYIIIKFSSYQPTLHHIQNLHIFIDLIWL